MVIFKNEVVNLRRSAPELFDRWWIVRHVEVEDDADQMLMFLKPLLSKVAPTGNFVVGTWLAWVRDHA